MEIHELNTFSGTLGSSDFFATDNGTDTSKVSAEAMFAPLNARIDNIIAGPAPSAEEVVDARLGAEALGSKTYQSLGAAIRGQVTDLKSDLNKHSNIITDNLMGVDVQQNLYEGSADWSGTWVASDPPKRSLSAETLDGYPVMYYSESWRKYYKLIPVVAGKTYTFEAWIKTAVAGTVAIYALDSNASEPATISPSVTAYSNTPANEWKKLSITFTCTASGNINPYVTSRAGAFYFAKYVLVEGDSAFSLSNELNDRPTKNNVSIGDYKKYEFSVQSVGGLYWNPEIEKNVKVGDKVRFIFDSYSGTKLSYVRVDGRKNGGTYTGGLCQINAPKWGDSVEFTASENYTALRIQFGRTEQEDNVSASVYLQTNSEIGISRDLMGMVTQHIYHVEKDGSGDFISFVDAINTACQFMDSVVYVGAGTYDLLDELGSDYIKSAGSQKMGVVLKNRVHVICSSQTILEMDNSSDLYDTEAQYLAAKEYLSPINTGQYGCILENATIVDNNVRYSIHDDQGWGGSTPYTNKFINCTLIHKNGMYGDCIGGGLGENCCVELRGCYLEGDVSVERLAYYHANNHTGITDAKGHIIVCDNYFANSGAFWLHKYGDSTEMTTALVSNNSFGSEPQTTSGTGAQDNMRMIAWNNEIRS